MLHLRCSHIQSSAALMIVVLTSKTITTTLEDTYSRCLLHWKSNTNRESSKLYLHKWCCKAIQLHDLLGFHKIRYISVRICSSSPHTSAFEKMQVILQRKTKNVLTLCVGWKLYRQPYIVQPFPFVFWSSMSFLISNFSFLSNYYSHHRHKKDICSLFQQKLHTRRR